MKLPLYAFNALDYVGEHGFKGDEARNEARKYLERMGGDPEVIRALAWLDAIDKDSWKTALTPGRVAKRAAERAARAAPVPAPVAAARDTDLLKLTAAHFAALKAMSPGDRFDIARFLRRYPTAGTVRIDSFYSLTPFTTRTAFLTFSPLFPSRT
jgi:hypothetical protein